MEHPMQILPAHGVSTHVHARQNRIAERGALAHALLKLTLEQHRWILDLENPFAIEAELAVLMQLMPRRTMVVANTEPAIYHWAIQSVREILVWLAARRPEKLLAEPNLPRIPIKGDVFITVRSPDMRFIMHGTGQHVISEVKSGKGGSYVSENKLIWYGIADLLMQHKRGNPLDFVQLRWLGLVYPGENGVAPDCQQMLYVRRRKLTVEGANRWLIRRYNMGFQNVLDNLVLTRKLTI